MLNNSLNTYKINFKNNQIEYIFSFLIYLLPFSIVKFSFLNIYKIPYSYLILMLLSINLIVGYKFLDLKLDKSQLALFFISINCLIISYITNDNYSIIPVIGIVSRMFSIMLASLFKIDLKILFRSLINSLPFYLISLIFSDKLKLFESIRVNSNNLAASLVSVILFIFLLKAKYTFLKISYLNYLKIILPAFFVLLLTESRSVLFSTFLSFILVASTSQFKYFINALKIKISSIKFIFSFLLGSVIILTSIFSINSSGNLSRYYFLNINSNTELINEFEMVNSDQMRFYLFTYSISDILQKPFFGNGAGNDQKVFSKIKEYTNTSNKRKSLHNVYLTIAYQFGIPLLVFLILFVLRSIFINFNNEGNNILNVIIFFYVFLGLFNDIFAKNYFVLILVLISFNYKYRQIS